jgi:hypothetical protein
MLFQGEPLVVTSTQRAEIEEIARGIFTSVADQARKLRHYINAYSKDAKPFRWKYSNSSRGIRHL